MIKNDETYQFVDVDQRHDQPWRYFVDPVWQLKIAQSVIHLGLVV
jgi:hypothetical protein